MDIAVIGAGNRARKYLSCLPDGVRVRCMVEPEELRLHQASDRCGVPPEGRFSSTEEFFAAPCSGVEAAVIAVPDLLHVPIALQCVRKGLHVLLEKPVAPDAAQYELLMREAAAVGVHVGVCLEMRFHPYFKRLRELALGLGPLVSIEHTEHIGPDRMAHTFVRGLWSRKEDSGPIFLSKCSHDADFIFWLTGARSFKVLESRGALTRFCRAGAPDGAAGRCLGCPVDASCRYSAVDLYSRRGAWTSGFDVPEGRTLEDVIDAELRNGRYGRCVYACDNDVNDVQTVTALLDDSIRLTMSLEGTSLQEGRSTVIKGREGTVEAAFGKLSLRGSGGALQLEEDYSHLAGAPLHAGADRELVADFFRAVSEGRGPSASLESAYLGHMFCYEAEN